MMIQPVQVSPASELNLSNLVLGLWRLSDLPVNELSLIIHQSLEVGITSIDQADIYGNYQSQKYFGKLLQQEPSMRDNLQIVSKCGIVIPGSPRSTAGIGYYSTSVEHILQSVEQTLTDLHCTHLDLLLIHRPSPLMHPEVVDEAFQKLKKAGKVLHFGVSNFTPSQFDMLSQRMETPLITNQIEFSVMQINPIYDGTLDTCLKNNIRPMIWSPLAGGRLFSDHTECSYDLLRVMNEIALELGNIPIDQLALAWILKHPSKPIPVIGTLKSIRIASAVAAFKVEMTEEQWFRILVASQGHGMP